MEDLGIALGPSVVDSDAFEAPFLAVPGQLAVVAVHEEGVLGPAPRTFVRHEVLRHDVGGERGRIVADLDPEVGGGMASIEGADEREDGIEDDGLRCVRRFRARTRARALCTMFSADAHGDRKRFIVRMKS